MTSFLDNELKSVGVETKLVELGEQQLEGKTLKLPPAILGKIGSDTKKKTILIYGHYDVQPVRVPPRPQCTILEITLFVLIILIV